MKPTLIVLKVPFCKAFRGYAITTRSQCKL